MTFTVSGSLTPNLILPRGFNGAVLGEGLSGRGEKRIIWTFSLEESI